MDAGKMVNHCVYGTISYYFIVKLGRSATLRKNA